MSRYLVASMVMLVIAASNSTVFAQSRFGGSGMSAFGSSGFGSSGFGSGGMGSGGFGGGGFGSSGFGSSGFGSSGFGGMGGSGFGSGGMGGGGMGMQSFGGGGFGGSGMGGQMSGMGGYGGGQNFIGRDSGDMAATFSEMGRAGTQFFNQANRQMQRGNRDTQPAQAIANPPQPMRVALQVAFTGPKATPATVANSLRTRVGKILASHNIAQPIVTLEGDTAVLGGVAATESQRLVLEKLIALEPGVRQVRNEMVVAGAPATGLPATGN